MNTETIEIKSHEQWLGERTKDITSTEVSALFGLSPYMTEFELFHQKREGVVVKLEPNERMKWGNRLESAIAHGAAEDMGWQIEPMKIYMRDKDARIGSSFDFEIKSSANGKGILEIKNVDWVQYQKNWIDDGAGNIEAPEHIELQVQHQMEVAGYDWCAIVALVGGNEQKIVLRNRDRDIGKSIRDKSTAFWKSVTANQAPSADYTRDAEYIIKQLRRDAQEGLIAEADAELEDMIKQFEFVRKEASDLDKIKDQKRAEILDRIGMASKVITSFGSLSTGQVKGRSGTLITPEMVGTVIGATEGYRSFRFYSKKEK
jgi:putative phage-type endonuclease